MKLEFLGGGKFGDGSLEKILKEITGGEDKIIKSIDCKKDWAKEFNLLKKRKDKLIEESKKIKADGEKIWAKIRLELNDFQSSLSFNEETGQIDYLGQEGGINKDNGGIPSPF